MKCRGSECSLCLLVLRYIQSLFTYVQRKQFLSLLVVSDLLEKFPFGVDNGWLCGVTYRVIPLGHVPLYCDNVKCSCVFHVSFSYKIQTKVAPAFSVFRFIVTAGEI